MECRPNGERVVLGPTLDVDGEIKHCSFPCTWKHRKARDVELWVKGNDFRLFIILIAQSICVNVRFSNADHNKSVEDFWNCKF